MKCAMEEGIQTEKSKQTKYGNTLKPSKKFHELRYKREETKWEQNTITSKENKRGTARRKNTDKQANKKQ
jgi:hypothetical protein